MRLVRQPEGSRLCGQACVAMLLGISLDGAVELVGTRRGLRARQIVEALRTGSVHPGPRIMGAPPHDKRTALVTLLWTERRRANHFNRVKHQVVLHRGRIFDSMQERSYHRAEYERLMAGTSLDPFYLGDCAITRFTSWLPIP